MKQHGSVFLLMVRSTFYKVLLLLGAATLAETAVFVAFCLRGPTAKGFGPELLLRQGRIAWIFGAVMVLMTLLLIRTGTEKGAKTGYTLRRLSVSERWVFFWQSAYNTLCYLLLISFCNHCLCLANVLLHLIGLRFEKVAAAHSSALSTNKRTNPNFSN